MLDRGDFDRERWPLTVEGFDACRAMFGLEPRVASDVSLRHHEIAEARHRILNPLTEDKLRLLGEVTRVGRGHPRPRPRLRQGRDALPLGASGSARPGSGVDLSTVFLAARRRACRASSASPIASSSCGRTRVSYPIEPGGFDVVCLHRGDLDRRRARPARLGCCCRRSRPGGQVLLGEPYWTEPPPDEAYEALGVGRDEFASLEGTLDRIEAAGLELIEMVLADGDSWDRYEAAQWRTISDWLAANPDDPEHAAMRRLPRAQPPRAPRVPAPVPRLGRVRDPRQPLTAPPSPPPRRNIRWNTRNSTIGMRVEIVERRDEDVRARSWAASVGRRTDSGCRPGRAAPAAARGSPSRPR